MSDNTRSPTRNKSTAAERPFEILMVEDNTGDVRLTSEAFRKLGLANNMNSVGDGVEAMAFLRHQGKYASVPRPDLILLDLNLPKKDGREVLLEIKNDEGLRDIPVIALTGSKADQDIITSYKFRANCFVSKTGNMGQLIEVIRFVRDSWLKPQDRT